MIRDIDSSARQTIGQQQVQQHQLIYQYLRQGASSQTPPELIQKFQHLLQQGKNDDTQVTKALEKIIFAEESQFHMFLSQCFYTILDSWLHQSESLVYLDQLLNTLDVVCKASSYDRCRKQLIQLIKNYKQTEFYQQLKLIIALIHPSEVIAKKLDNSLVTNESADISNSLPTSLIDAYLIRYPYLYQCFLPQDFEAQKLIEAIQQLQSDRQKNFEILLSRHIIYRFRLKQFAQMRMMATGAGKMIMKVANPSLLSAKAFQIALQQYVGKIEQNNTLLERSQRFVAENKYRQTYQVFKQDLHRLLASNIKPRNNTYQFSSLLEQKLVDIFPQANDKPLNQTQILQTCRQLFSFLIPDPRLNEQRDQFAELVANLGTAQTMMVLIKMTLICPESKADLEKKICMIATHYQHQTIRQVPWLIKSLEHLLIAFSIYFGNIDVSIAKSALSNEQ
ncbi:MAG: hypothetical protein HC939_19850 [Pleurocapsa sp. SU_5_0]|nr:hypothetical protein [Pleurocapsa sp. SU_5_0]NJO98586.1 hypothetical protein [Pleurocapsa sp. CRU_1_2]